MLPVQYLRRAGQRLAEPQKRLMLAVLQTVVDDYQDSSQWRLAGDASVADQRAARDAAAYVASADRSWPFSFENICEAIGVDADRLRRGLQETVRTR